jgi:hypothetical protein
MPLSGLLDLAGTSRIALTKVDIEGAVYDAFAATGPETPGRIERLVIEYHDNLRPGTLALLKARLEPNHRVTVAKPHSLGNGILFAVRRP